MKDIAIITGASSGMGKELVKLLPSSFSFDEVWVIARSLDKLEELKKIIPFAIKPISLDLSNEKSFDELTKLLEEEKPNVKFLANCSGFGKFALSTEIPLNDSLNMIDLNCKAVVAMCNITLNYMKEGAKILNIASVAGFQPIPYINVYGASKAFVLSYSRALNSELKQRKISVTAVCPFWTKTAFFDRANITKDAVVKKYVVMYDPVKVIKKALKDTIKGKELSIYGFKANFQVLLVKILPHSIVMKVWKNQQKLK